MTGYCSLDHTKDITQQLKINREKMKKNEKKQQLQQLTSTECCIQQSKITFA